MAMGYKCDKCGKFYEYPAPASDLSIRVMPDGARPSRDDKHKLDLCLHCTWQIVRLIAPAYADEVRERVESADA